MRQNKLFSVHKNNHFIFILIIFYVVSILNLKQTPKRERSELSTQLGLEIRIQELWGPNLPVAAWWAWDGLPNLAVGTGLHLASPKILLSNELVGGLAPSNELTMSKTYWNNFFGQLAGNLAFSVLVWGHHCWLFSCCTSRFCQFLKYMKILHFQNEPIPLLTLDPPSVFCIRFRVQPCLVVRKFEGKKKIKLKINLKLINYFIGYFKLIYLILLLLYKD